MPLPKRLSSPSFWHYGSLVAGLAVILLLQRGQWFFFDEWAFLKIKGPGLLEPHVGHWSTSPMLVFEGLRGTVGLHNYFPYAVLVTLIHLAIAHLVWRLTLRSGASGWIATTATTVFVFLGAGAENILWAFQIGFLGAIALGLLAFWLATAEEVSTRRFVAIVLVAAFSLTWAGTALPLVLATAFVLFRRKEWRRVAVLLGTTGGIYLTWYLIFALGSPSNPDTGGFAPHKLFVEMPVFLGVMAILGFGKVFPIVGLGAVLLAATAVWLFRLFRSRNYARGLDPALALGAAAVVFAGLAAFSRADFSLGAGRSSRYIYTLVAFLLPLLSVALSRAAKRWRRGLPVASAALVALACYQGGALVQVAHQQSVTEQGSRGQLSAALVLYVNDPGELNIRAQPEGAWAPDMTMADLIDLYRAGWIDIGPYTPDEMRRATAALVTTN